MNIECMKHLKYYKKEIIKCILFLGFLALFIRFYLIQVFKQYLKGGTTLSSFTENVESLPAPYITFCFNPSFKSSMLKNYELTQIDMNYNNFIDLESNVSLWDLYQNLSFQHQKDFNISNNSMGNMFHKRRRINFCAIGRIWISGNPLLFTRLRKYVIWKPTLSLSHIIFGAQDW